MVGGFGLLRSRSHDLGMKWRLYDVHDDCGLVGLWTIRLRRTCLGRVKLFSVPGKR